jgi:hypothetical protein
MLPLFALAPCNACGHQNQGTRGKGGNSVRCAGCGTMRRIPVDRPDSGPDDPRASTPRRGRPFPPGHPYRFQADASRPAPQKPARTPVRQAPRARPASSAPASQARPQRAPTTSPRPAPARAVIPARGQSSQYATFEPYRPCENCMEEKGWPNGAYAPSVARIAMWEGSKPLGDGNVCGSHFDQFAELVRTRSDIRMRILEKPEPGSYSRSNANAPRNGVSGYVNPTTCSHSSEVYDGSADVYRCLNCYNARPAYM